MRAHYIDGDIEWLQMYPIPTGQPPGKYAEEVPLLIGFYETCTTDSGGFPLRVLETGLFSIQSSFSFREVHKYGEYSILM